MYGYSYRTCQCEDFPCCGHNDVDPNWEPDPYDAYDEGDYDEGEEPDPSCVLCDGRGVEVYDGELLCAPCLALAAPRRSKWVHAPSRDGSGCVECGAFAQVNPDGECRDCFKK